jgi:hypothetical protein
VEGLKSMDDRVLTFLLAFTSLRSWRREQFLWYRISLARYHLGDTELHGLSFVMFLFAFDILYHSLLVSDI